MTAITEIKLIMRTSIVDEQIESGTQTRNMNSTTISNRKERYTYGATGAAPLVSSLLHGTTLSKRFSDNLCLRKPINIIFLFFLYHNVNI